MSIFKSRRAGTPALRETQSCFALIARMNEVPRTTWTVCMVASHAMSSRLLMLGEPQHDHMRLGGLLHAEPVHILVPPFFPSRQLNFGTTAYKVPVESDLCGDEPRRRKDFEFVSKRSTCRAFSWAAKSIQLLLGGSPLSEQVNVARYLDSM